MAQSDVREIDQEGKEHPKRRFDARDFAYIAEQVIEGRRLSTRQLYWAFQKLPKYAGQLYKMVVEKTTIMHCPCGQPILADGAEYRCLGCGFTTPRSVAA